MTTEDELPQVAFEQGDDITSRVRRIAVRLPTAPALVDGQRRLTWRDLDADVDRVAHALVRSGIGKGNRVAILGQNSIEYVETLLGVLRLGGSIVPLPSMATVPTLRAMLDDAQCAALFVGDESRQLGEQLVGAADGTSPELTITFGPAGGSFLGFGDWMPAAATRFPSVPLAADDEFDVMYSSGTTGVPKGVVHSHGARKASYAGSRARLFSEHAINLVATPFYSNTTCITWLLTTAAGGCNVLMSKFDAGAFLELVAKERVSHAMLVPVQYDRILRHPDFDAADLTSLRYQFSTSAPLRADVKRALLERTPGGVFEIYGTTEGGVVCMLEARRYPNKLASVGRPVPACSMTIIDDAGAEVPRGQTGEVVGRCPNMTSGYLNQPEATRALHWRDGSGQLYYRSGDLGRFDEDGFLFLLDRKKDVIISGGLNVYATDIEAILLAHPSVAEAAVVGVPSDRWGESPWAFVVAEAQTRVSEAGLLEWCNGQLGKHQRVSGLGVVSSLPKNAIGKVLKRQLRAMHEKLQ